VRTFPQSEGALPQLPPKSIICMPSALCVTLRIFSRAFSEIPAEVPRKEKDRPRLLSEVCFLVQKKPQDLGANTCSCVLLNPEFSGSPVLKEFLFS